MSQRAWSRVLEWVALICGYALLWIAIGINGGGLEMFGVNGALILAGGMLIAISVRSSERRRARERRRK